MGSLWRWVSGRPAAWTSAAWYWLRTRLAGLAALVAANAPAVTFTVALAVASVGFGLAWLPLGLIFPGLTICGIMVAWRWQSTFRRDDD